MYEVTKAFSHASANVTRCLYYT